MTTDTARLALGQTQPSTRGALLATSVLLAVIGAIAASPASGEELGRLFYSPERRATLDRARQFNVQTQQQVAEGNTLSVNGVVRRASGKRTVWVNGVAVHENSVTDVRVVGVSPGGTVSLIPGDQGITHIPVGTALNRNTGERSDALNGGSIVVRPATGSARSP